MQNIKICLNEVQTLEQSHQICLNSKFKIFGLPPLHMQNTRSRSFLGVKFLFMNRCSKFLWQFLRLFEYKRMTISYLYVGVLKQDDMQKGGFQRMV